MQFYLINNTSWNVPEAFLKWLLVFIKKDLAKHKSLQKDLRKQVGIVIVNGSKMQSLNRQFRGKNKVTDVLSFSGEGFFLGDIVICRQKVIKQAKEHGISAPEELAYLILHGLLHLLGYDHEKSRIEEKKMFQLQDNLFAVLQDKDILRAFERFN